METGRGQGSSITSLNTGPNSKLRSSLLAIFPKSSAPTQEQGGRHGLRCATLVLVVDGRVQATTSDLVPFCSRMQGLCSIFAFIWAPKTAGVTQPLVILSPLIRTPEYAAVMQYFCP